MFFILGVLGDLTNFFTCLIFNKFYDTFFSVCNCRLKSYLKTEKHTSSDTHFLPIKTDSKLGVETKN